MTETDNSEHDLLDVYRTSPMNLPLHIVDEDGDSLCGNLTAKQERFMEHHEVDILPTLEESRDGERWMYFFADLCQNCRKSLLANTDDSELHEEWQERQRRLDRYPEVPA